MELADMIMNMNQRVGTGCAETLFFRFSSVGSKIILLEYRMRVLKYHEYPLIIERLVIKTTKEELLICTEKPQSKHAWYYGML